MTQIVKRLVPKGIIRSTVEAVSRLTARSRPKITTFRGHSDSVLQCCIAYNQYGGYCIPLSSRHRPAARKVMAGGVWEADTVAYLTSNDTDDDVVHAGAFFGDFLPALAQSRAAGATVWAFEPNPENYRCALITTHINELNNVVLANSGLGEKQASLPLLVSDSSGRSLGGASRIVGESDANEGRGSSTLVKIVTIDEAVPSDRNVATIHLDVEGYEKSALMGALNTIRRCHPTLVLETLPDQSWISTVLTPLGYQVVGQVHNNTILKCA